MEMLVLAFQETETTRQTPHGDRFYLKPPVFSEEGNIEQVIQELKDVANLAECPTQVAVLQL